MKILAASLCAVALLSTARADSLTSDDEAQAARALKITGATLSAAGGALALVSIVTGLIDYAGRAQWNAPDRPIGSMTFAAIGLGAGGVALMAVGIPLLVKGQRRLEKLDLRLAAAPLDGGGSLTLAVRF